MQTIFHQLINLCCKQLNTCSTFQSSFNKNTFIIRHNVTCKSCCVVYLMEWCFCKKTQYVRKLKCNLNLRIHTHRNDVWRTAGPPHNKNFRSQVMISTIMLSLLSLNKLKISPYLSQEFATY